MTKRHKVPRCTFFSSFQALPLVQVNFSSLAILEHPQTILKLSIPCLLDRFIPLLYEPNSPRQLHVNVKTLIRNISVKIYHDQGVLCTAANRIYKDLCYDTNCRWFYRLWNFVRSIFNLLSCWYTVPTDVGTFLLQQVIVGYILFLCIWFSPYIWYIN
jgi:hypothetical protein